MKIGLFTPCYINQYYPRIGISTYNLLKKIGYEVEYPMEQTCCGQPLANSGFERYTNAGIEHFRNIFKNYATIVSPSGSCVLFVRDHPLFKESPKQKIMELSEFLLEYDGINTLSASYPRKVGILQSCHGLRGLQLGKSSELVGKGKSNIRQVLNCVKEIQIVKTDRADDCCGFGGTFSVKEPDLSVKMGLDRLDDFLKNGAEVITSTDISCLMHLEGIIMKRKLKLEVKHFSEILMPS